MALCVNKNSSEFQILHKMSGLPEFTVEAFCSEFSEKYGRFPHLDELPDVDSSTYLEELLKTKKNGAKIENILDYTGAESVEEATVLINNTHRDLEVELIPLKNEAFVKVTKRPTKYGEFTEEKVIDSEINQASLLTGILSRLQKLYGINIIPITTYELQHGELSKYVPEAAFTNAFVFNGNIYINTDVASIDAPIHEMLHLFVGSLRFTNPELYLELLLGALNFENYKNLISLFLNRTQNDINEEILIQELSKYLVGLPSNFDSLDNRSMYEISYNINRMLDSIFMGDVSTSLIDSKDILGMSLRSIAEKVNASTLHNAYKQLDNIHIHRLVMNTKSKLLKEGKLLENCR